MVGVVAEYFALAGRGADLALDAEHDGNVLERMEAVGDEEWYDDDVGRLRQLIPLRDEGLLLHVGIEHRCVASIGCRDELDLVADGFGGILIKAGAVSSDDQSSLGWSDVRGDFPRSLENEIGHRAVYSNGQAVVERLAADDCGCPGELEFAGNDVLREISLADEIRHHVDVVRIDQIKGFTHRRFLFPKAAMNLGEKSALANFIGVFEVGSGGVRILGGSVTYDEQSAVWLGRD